MTLWIALAALAQLITALIVLIDKYVLVSHEHIGRPIVYAFYVSLLSGFVVVLAPFGLVAWPSEKVLVLSLFSSISFVVSVYFLYTSLRRGHAADTVPFVGAISAIATVGLALFVLAEDMPPAFVPAFVLFVIGMALISHFRFSLCALRHVALAGIFFALSAVLLKLVFIETSFLDGFFWSRMTNVFVALSLLSIPMNRRLILHGYSRTSGKAKGLVVFNKVLGGVAGILTLFAIKLGSVSVVSAMAGLQFLFLIVLVWFGARLFPRVFKEELHPHKYPNQILGAVSIGAGLATLFLL